MPAFAPVHFQVGPVVVTWGGQQLGYSEDGVTINIQPFYDNVPSDDFGGRAGPPSDAQILGAIASMDINLTKYNRTLANALSQFNSAGMSSPTPGILPPIGTFVRQDGLFAALVLTGPREITSWPVAHLRRNFEMNSGTKWRMYRCGFECWMSQTDYTALLTANNRTLFTLV